MPQASEESRAEWDGPGDEKAAAEKGLSDG